MHMSDALLSPAVGGTMWIAAAGSVALCARRVGRAMDNRNIPFMGVLAAFIFAGQMVNFTIPGTGSSGHLGGGMILAVLLGPCAAFLAMASILTVQALFFADGGLLALGCNMFNLGFLPIFIAYPLLFRPLAGGRPSPGRLTGASLAAAVIGMQLGVMGVVLETVASGVADLPFRSFAALMLTIHVPIGIVEGLATAAVVGFVRKARPEVVGTHIANNPSGNLFPRRVVTLLALVALLTAGALSWFASTSPDGLEWAIGRSAGTEKLRESENEDSSLTAIQEKTALLPDYGFKHDGASEDSLLTGEGKQWPKMSSETSLSGLVGGALTIILTAAVAYAAKRRYSEAPTRGSR